MKGRSVRYVPARVGGVDLSIKSWKPFKHSTVPARVGGVDLSLYASSLCSLVLGPRPCGRGGFKQHEYEEVYRYHLVPARVGGVDLSKVRNLSLSRVHSPRPCGRGGFKPSIAAT